MSIYQSNPQLRVDTRGWPEWAGSPRDHAGWLRYAYCRFLTSARLTSKLRLAGELFDLESLSQERQRQTDWTCLITSAPLHVRGGVESQPNGIAIVGKFRGEDLEPVKLEGSYCSGDISLHFAYGHCRSRDPQTVV